MAGQANRANHKDRPNWRPLHNSLHPRNRMRHCTAVQVYRSVMGIAWHWMRWASANCVTRGVGLAALPDGCGVVATILALIGCQLPFQNSGAFLCR